MTIDERLEAISQSLQILTGMQHQNEKRSEQYEKRFEQDAENIRALARIAEIHEHRLTHLEGDQE